MTLSPRVTIHIDERIAQIVDRVARRDRVLRQDVVDGAIHRHLAEHEPATLRRIARDTAATLRAKGVSVPAGGWPAYVVRQHVEVPRFVGEADRLVREGDGWIWQRVSQKPAQERAA